MTAEKKKETIKKILSDLEDILNFKFDEDPEFTGKIIYSIDCRNGGIGGSEAYVQKKIKKSD